MARPIRTGLVLLFLATTAARADAQSLADAARRAEAGRKTAAVPSLVFDERDLNPSIAEQEVLQFAIDAARWPRFLTADRLVAEAFVTDPSVVARLQAVKATGVRALERFLQREPALIGALTAAGTDAREYTYTHMAVAVAVVSMQRADSAAVPPSLPETVRENIAFVKAHEADLKSLGKTSEKLAVRVAPALSSLVPPAAAPAPSGAASPSPSAPAARTLTPTADVIRTKVDDFEFVDFTGARRRLSDFRGRYVLLDFWGVWCPNCRAEVPYLKEAYAQFQGRGLEIIGMDYEKSASVDQVRRYLAENGITWTFARPDSVRDVIRNQFQIDGFPTQMLIDPNGDRMEVPSGAFRGARLARTLDMLLPK